MEEAAHNMVCAASLPFVELAKQVHIHWKRYMKAT